ncbi:MAG TPA: hypothetical protein VFR14_04230 [Candidatus Limnocylindrales bacterium]|nr:hypothetical protein [Candidatus Limnocylindrales bacterium]
MDTPRPIRLPAATRAEADRELAEVAAAVELVARGVARRVVLVGLEELAALAGDALVIAQQAGVRFALQREPGRSGTVLAIVGPRTT